MRFVKTLTVTAGATIAAPSSTSLRLIKGTLTHIEIAFPPGPADYVHVVIMDRNLQIAPANPEQTFSWDNYTHGFSMNYPITDPPYELILLGWSPDANYDHVITFSIATWCAFFWIYVDLDWFSCGSCFCAT